MTGGAWVAVSSCREMLVKSCNERNPVVSRYIQLGTWRDRRVTNWRKVGMTSNQHAPYGLGYTRATMDGTASW